MAKKYQLKWVSNKNKERYFTLETHGKCDQFGVLELNKAEIMKLAVKFLYWQVNCYNGECWPDSTAYILVNDEWKPLNNIVYKGRYIGTRISTLVDCVTRDIRFMVFYN